MFPRLSSDSQSSYAILKPKLRCGNNHKVDMNTARFCGNKRGEKETISQYIQMSIQKQDRKYCFCDWSQCHSWYLHSLLLPPISSFHLFPTSTSASHILWGGPGRPDKLNLYYWTFHAINGPAYSKSSRKILKDYQENLSPGSQVFLLAPIMS